MNEPTMPKSIIELLLSEMDRAATTVARWQGETAATPLRHLITEIRAILSDPMHQWVSTREAAQRLGKSEETVRRWCRENRAEFRFHQLEENGRYEVWLADLSRKEMFDAA